MIPDDFDPTPYVESQVWVFAKTVPEHPHYYVVLARSTDPDTHMRFVRWLQTTGEVEYFQRRPYRYRTVDDWRYWVGPATIINRRRADGQMRLDL